MTGVVAMAVAAVFAVESDGGRNVRVSDGGRAVGAFQMWPVAVDEANRIHGHKHWTYADRRDPGKAREMCRTTLEHHYRRGTRDPAGLACKWHRPYGKCSPAYRAKIERALRMAGSSSATASPAARGSGAGRRQRQ